MNKYLYGDCCKSNFYHGYEGLALQIIILLRVWQKCGRIIIE